MTDRDASAVLNLLGDDYAREIIRAISTRPMSAKELTQALDISQPTVSRRLQSLEDEDLVVEQTRLDPDGHHYSVYIATLEEARIRLEDGSFRLTITREQTAADRLSYIFREMRGE